MKLVVCQNYLVERILTTEMGLPLGSKAKRIYNNGNGAGRVTVSVYEKEQVGFLTIPAGCSKELYLTCGLDVDFDTILILGQDINSVQELSEALDWVFTESISCKLATRIFGVKQPLNDDYMQGIDSILLSTLTSIQWKGRLKTPEEGDSCVVCKTHKATITFMPCQHQCACDECAKRLMEDNMPCPVCRVKPGDLFRPYV